MCCKLGQGIRKSWLFLGIVAEAAVSKFLERTAQSIALAYSGISSTVVADSLCISGSDASNFGWSTKNGGYLVRSNPSS